MNEQLNDARHTEQMDTAKQQSSAVLTDELDELASEANKHHHECCRSMCAAIKHAHFAGQMLCSAKDRVGHGNFTEWLEENFDGSVETARVYMRVARNWQRLEPEVNRPRDLSLKRALDILTVKPSDGDSVEPTSDEEATDILREEFRLAIIEWSSDERIFLATHCSLFGLIEKLRRRIAPLAPVFVAADRRHDTPTEKLSIDEFWKGTPELDDRRSMENLRAFRHADDLTPYQKSVIWRAVKNSDVWKDKPWLIGHIRPQAPEDDGD